jgi:hypothetical protein
MHLFIFLDSVALAPQSCRKRIKKRTLPTATQRQPQQVLNIESFYKGLCSMLLPSGSIACAGSSNCQARQPCSFLSRKASARATRMLARFLFVRVGRIEIGWPIPSTATLLLPQRAL